MHALARLALLLAWLCVCAASHDFMPIAKSVGIHVAASSPSAQTARLISLVPQPQMGSSQTSMATDLPAGTPLAGEYILLYQPGVQDVKAAAADSQLRASAFVAAAAAAGTISAASLGSSRPAVTVLSAQAAPTPGIPSQAVIQVPVELDPQAVREALLSGPGVRAVLQNKVVRLPRLSLAAACSSARVAAGISATSWTAEGFEWGGCLTNNTVLAFFGQRCGSGLSKFRWLGVYAARKSNHQLFKPDCVRTTAFTTNSTVRVAYFGGCGVKPKNFPELPTEVCMESAGSACLDATALSSYSTTLSKRTCSSATAGLTATFSGTPCGPNGTFIQWNKLATPGCPVKYRPQDAHQRADWLGQCGVPPYQAKGLPTRICAANQDSSNAPPPSPGDSQSPTPPVPQSPSPAANPEIVRAPLKAGDSAEWGMERVGAYDSSTNTVVDAASAIAAAGIYYVVTIDTGADTKHPDLKIADFVDFVNDNSSIYYNRDGNAHGTHVAGIIGARNNGAGITGVVPGMPIIALKVLDEEGSGYLNTIYKAFAHVLELLQSGKKIAAVNMSLTVTGDGAAPDAADVEAMCGYIADIAAYGTAVVVAAGNDGGADVGNVLPGMCPDAMAVTALTSKDVPAAFSNAARLSSPAVLKATILAAPGQGINSTYPVAQGSYEVLDGTSMAAPSVSGGFALCVLSGVCKLSAAPGVTPAATANYPLMLAAAKASPCGQYVRCGPGWGSSAYYGYMLNVTKLW